MLCRVFVRARGTSRAPHYSRNLFDNVRNHPDTYLREFIRCLFSKRNSHLPALGLPMLAGQALSVFGHWMDSIVMADLFAWQIFKITNWSRLLV